jgi:HEAT repeat protein/Tfp pilus assembly protein PilF
MSPHIDNKSQTESHDLHMLADQYLKDRIRIESHDLHIPENASDLAKQCGSLFREGQYEKGIALARSVPDFERNAVAQRQVGLGLAYMGEYLEARKHFQQGAQLSTEPHIWANCAANTGTTFLEEYDLDRAEQMYKEALEIEPDNKFGLLGCITVACQRRDRDALERAVWILVERCQDWSTSDLIVSTLVRDRSFRFLRENMSLFKQVFGATVNELALERVTSPEDCEEKEAPEIKINDVDSITSRIQEVKSLGPIGTPEALHLLAVFCTDQEPFVRQEAAMALGRIGTPEALHLLVALCTDQEPFVRQEAAMALGRIGTPEALHLLVALCTDQDSLNKGRTAEFFDKIDNPEAIIAIAKSLEGYSIPQAVEVLCIALTSQNPLVRQKVTELLEQSGGPQAIEAFIRVLTDSEDSIARNRAVEALARHNTLEAIEGLAVALSDKNSNVKLKATEALSRKRLPPEISNLAKDLSSDDPAYRRQIFKVLIQEVLRTRLLKLGLGVGPVTT